MTLANYFKPAHVLKLDLCQSPTAQTLLCLWFSADL